MKFNIGDKVKCIKPFGDEMNTKDTYIITDSDVDCFGSNPIYYVKIKNELNSDFDEVYLKASRFIHTNFLSEDLFTL